MTLYLTIIHLLGLALGAGGAFVSDALFLRSIRDRKISNDEIRLMNISGLMTWLGFILLFLSGVGLFFGNPDRFLESSKFITKMGVVAMIFLNGLILHAYHLPFMKKHVGKAFHLADSFEYRSKLMVVSGAISVSSWFTALVLGSISSLPFTVTELMSVYVVFVITSALCALFLRKRVFGLTT